MLTAHPTEVRRKSTLARELEIADLLEERARAEGDPAELAANEEKPARRPSAWTNAAGGTGTRQSQTVWNKANQTATVERSGDEAQRGNDHLAGHEGADRPGRD